MLTEQNDARGEVVRKIYLSMVFLFSVPLILLLLFKQQVFADLGSGKIPTDNNYTGCGAGHKSSDTGDKSGAGICVYELDNSPYYTTDYNDSGVCNWFCPDEQSCNTINHLYRDIYSLGADCEGLWGTPYRCCAPIAICVPKSTSCSTKVQNHDWGSGTAAASYGCDTSSQHLCSMDNHPPACDSFGIATCVDSNSCGGTSKVLSGKDCLKGTVCCQSNFTLFTPRSGTSGNTPDDINFSWSKVPNAQSYTIHIKFKAYLNAQGQKGPTPPDIDIDAGNNTNHDTYADLFSDSPVVFTPNVRYQWTVEAHMQDGSSLYPNQFDASGLATPITIASSPLTTSPFSQPAGSSYSVTPIFNTGDYQTCTITHTNKGICQPVDESGGCPFGGSTGVKIGCTSPNVNKNPVACCPAYGMICAQNKGTCTSPDSCNADAPVDAGQADCQSNGSGNICCPNPQPAGGSNGGGSNGGGSNGSGSNGSGSGGGTGNPPDTPTPTPLPPKGAIAVHFEAIDPQNNPVPLHTQRQIILDFYPTNDYANTPPAFSIPVTVTYDGNQNSPTFGLFTNNLFDIQDIPNSSLYVLVKSPEGSLRELISATPLSIQRGMLNVIAGPDPQANSSGSSNPNSNSVSSAFPSNNANNPPPLLEMGDIDGNNTIDARDYSVMIDCYGDKKTQDSCTSHQGVSDSFVPLFADLNDDNAVNGVDYNLIARHFDRDGYGKVEN